MWSKSPHLGQCGEQALERERARERETVSAVSLLSEIEIFSIRSSMNALPANRGQIEYCEKCNEILNNTHILTCTILNKGKVYDMGHFLNGNIKEKRELLQTWRINVSKLMNI